MAITDIIKALQKHDVEVGEHAIDKLIEKIHEILMDKDSDLLESLEEYLGDVVKTVKESLKEETKQMVKNAKGKKVKDPNAPKRPPTAYNLFVAEKMKEVKEQHPEVTNQKELMKMAVALWHESKGEQTETKSKKDKAKDSQKLLTDTEPETNDEDSDEDKPSSSQSDAKKGKKNTKKGRK